MVITTKFAKITRSWEFQHVSFLIRIMNEIYLSKLVRHRQKNGQVLSLNIYGTDIWRVNPLRPRQDGRLFLDDIFKCIFFNENVQVLITISLTFVPKAPINNIPALVQIMDWRRPGDKPLSEPMMVSLLMHICVTRPQWVKCSSIIQTYSFISYYIWHCIKCCLHMFMLQNTYTIFYRYCIHIFYHCCCFYHDLYFACYLLSGNSSHS